MTSSAARIVAVAYVVVVAAIATYGFTTGSTVAILLAVAATLPTGVPALIGYYVVYGLLAQVAGANPDSSSGSCSSGGACQGSASGEGAHWFELTTDLTGTLALTLAAVVNVALAHLVIGLRRASSR